MTLKFRAWVNGTKSMHEVTFINLVSERVQLNDNKRYWYFSSDFKLMQFTGLYDSTSWSELSETEQNKWLALDHFSTSWHGKEIYEGDIMEFHFHDIGTQKAVVYFDQKHASFNLKPLGNFQYADFKDGMVIGNIYENLELLEEKTMNIPIYLYCTKAKPWLYYDEQKEKYALRYGKKKYTDLNGSVCFKCECKEAFKYDFVHRSGDSSNFYIRDQRTERMKDCLSNDDLFDYGKGKTLYALHLEKVEAVPQVGIGVFYKDKSCTQPLTKAPQSWCYAYQLVKGACFTQIRKILILSIRPEWLCKIANGEKDLEVRKTCPKEISRPNKCSK